jgi:hypothetical protein
LRALGQGNPGGVKGEWCMLPTRSSTKWVASTDALSGSSLIVWVSFAMTRESENRSI